MALSCCVVDECEGVIVVDGDDRCELVVPASGVDTMIPLLSAATALLSTILHLNLK